MAEEYATKFEVYPYFKTTYGFDPEVTVTSKKPVDVPYNSFIVARTYEDGRKQSFLRRDEGVSFEDSLANAIIHDEKTQFFTQGGFVTEENKTVSVVSYYVPVINKNSSIFQPTVMKPISDCCNVETDYDLEILFAFDDGYLVPVRKSYKTAGSFSCGFLDCLHSIVSALDFQDGVEEFFEDCPNAFFHDNMMVLVAGSQTSRITELEFDLSDRTCIHDLRRAVASIRLVKVEERII